MRLVGHKALGARSLNIVFPALPNNSRRSQQQDEACWGHKQNIKVVWGLLQKKRNPSPRLNSTGRMAVVEHGGSAGTVHQELHFALIPPASAPRASR